MIYEYGYFDIYWDACRDDVWIEKVVFQTTGKEIPESDYNYQEFKNELLRHIKIKHSPVHSQQIDPPDEVWDFSELVSLSIDI